VTRIITLTALCTAKLRTQTKKGTTHAINMATKCATLAGPATIVILMQLSVSASHVSMEECVM
jgi:hypothetical protein